MARYPASVAIERRTARATPLIKHYCKRPSVAFAFFALTFTHAIRRRGGRLATDFLKAEDSAACVHSRPHCNP